MDAAIEIPDSDDPTEDPSAASSSYYSEFSSSENSSSDYESETISIFSDRKVTFSQFLYFFVFDLVNIGNKSFIIKTKW